MRRWGEVDEADVVFGGVAVGWARGAPGRGVMLDEEKRMGGEGLFYQVICRLRRKSARAGDLRSRGMVDCSSSCVGLGAWVKAGRRASRWG